MYLIENLEILQKNIRLKDIRKFILLMQYNMQIEAIDR